MLVRAAPAMPPGLGFDLPPGVIAPLSRSHTSPSSVLLGLKPGMLGGVCGTNSFPTSLAPVSESHSSSELDLAASLAAQHGIVDALVNGGSAGPDSRHHSIGPGSNNGPPGLSLGHTIDGHHNSMGSDGNLTINGTRNGSMDGFPDSLTAAFARVTSLSSPDPSNGILSRRVSHDHGLDRTFSASANGSGMPPNPFAAAAAAAMSSQTLSGIQAPSSVEALG